MMGIVLLVVSPSFNLPFYHKPILYDGICVPTNLDGSLFLDNVAFSNFRIAYSE